MNCNALSLLCGLPGSGKTFLAKSIFHHLREKQSEYKNEAKSDLINYIPNVNLHLINYDELVSLSVQTEMIRLSGSWKKCRKDIFCAIECFIHHVCDLKLPYPFLSDHVKKLLEKLIQTKNIMKYNHNVFLIEDNFYYQSMRYEWYQLAKKLEMGFCQIYLNCPKEIALFQNEKREGKVKTDVIHLMAEKIEIPNESINKWEKNSIIINLKKGLDNICMNKILSIIDIALKNPETSNNTNESSKINAQKICSTNVVHQIDLLLRKLISEKIQKEYNSHSDKKSLKAFSTIVNGARTEIIKRLKMREIILDEYILVAIEEGRQFDIAIQLRKTFEPILDSFIN